MFCDVGCIPPLRTISNRNSDWYSSSQIFFKMPKNVVFRKKSSRKEVDLSENVVGTLQTIGGKGAKIAYNRKNFKGTSRVSIDLTKKNGDYQYFNCSVQVSAALRAGELRLGQLLGLDVIATDVTNKDPKSPNFNKVETAYFITFPKEGGRKEQEIDNIEVEELDESTSWLPEDLLSLDAVEEEEG